MAPGAQPAEPRRTPETSHTSPSPKATKPSKTHGFVEILASTGRPAGPPNPALRVPRYGKSSDIGPAESKADHQKKGDQKKASKSLPRASGGPVGAPRGGPGPSRRGWG